MKVITKVLLCGSFITCLAFIIGIDQVDLKNWIYIYDEKTLNSLKITREYVKDNWTILLAMNDGYFDFFRNWLHFYKKLNLKRSLHIIAEDDIVFFKLQRLNANSSFNVHRGTKNSTGSVVNYGSKGFNELASSRPTHILRYLQEGMDVLYVDSDSVWLWDPFPYFTGDFDMWMQVDTEPDKMCTGFMAVKVSNITLNLMRSWETSLKKHLDIDQTAFNNVYKKSTVQIKKLDAAKFPSGKLYFQQFDKNQKEKVIVVHNNFIIGYEEKLRRFIEYDLWFSNRTNKSRKKH